MGAVAQLDLFVVHAVNPPLRDNRDVMEFPFLSLQKKRMNPIIYRDDRVTLEVHAPTQFGLASIWDWDLIIFAASHLNEAIEAGLTPSPIVQFVPHDCLKQMGRGAGGKDYRELAMAVRRLRMTTIITDIRQDDSSGIEKPFSWLSDYTIPKRYSTSLLKPDSHDGEPDPARPWEIELPLWLYNSIVRRTGILAVHPDYFQLSGGLERWLYRLARKAVPEKRNEPTQWYFRMETLHERSGTSRPLKKFAFDLRRIADAQPLPEYGIKIVRDGKAEGVVLYRDYQKLRRPPRGFKQMRIEGRF